MNEVHNLQIAVHSMHRNLTEAITQMEPVILLRYAGPDDRPFHSGQLFKARIITKDEAKEFAKFVGGGMVS
jgi:hypothetical protein